MSNQSEPSEQDAESRTGITRLRVSGYKSIVENQAVDIRPLTILAGANSSGKSSIMQPLLLFKQTLETSYDPGPLLLDGPNVHLNSYRQIFSKIGEWSANRFTIAISETISGLDITFSETLTSRSKEGIGIVEVTAKQNDEVLTLKPLMTSQGIAKALPPAIRTIAKALSKQTGRTAKWKIVRRRCFLDLSLGLEGSSNSNFPSFLGISPPAFTMADMQIRRVIHVPGLRGNPARTYTRSTAISTTFPGTFENYVASIIHHWQSSKDTRLHDLQSMLRTLGLTYSIDARAVDDTTIELRVARLYADKGDAPDDGDMVSIADVGFGVSQTLPVLVALLVAEPSQLVYIEQPEIHLHPRAQSAMAQVLADAARRGVRVVVETHSSLLLLGIQTLVAEGLPAELVKLHWFTRQADGRTTITSSNVDESGAFDTNWPEDFADVTLKAESRYLDSAEARLIPVSGND
jgi:predicted ATPase